MKKELAKFLSFDEVEMLKAQQKGL